jgi:hypothetical protein
MAPPLEKLVDVNVGGTNFTVKAQYRGLKVIGERRQPDARGAKRAQRPPGPSRHAHL